MYGAGEIMLALAGQGVPEEPVERIVPSSVKQEPTV
jgi:hypothetical protein